MAECHLQIRFWDLMFYVVYRLKSVSFMTENELNRSQSGSDEDGSNSPSVEAVDGMYLLYTELKMMKLCVLNTVEPQLRILQKILS